MRSLTSLLRTLPLLPSSAAVLLALMVSSPEAAKAEACSVDPYGAEVCLPDEKPDKPDKPAKSNKPDKPDKPNKSEKPDKPNDPQSRTTFFF